MLVISAVRIQDPFVRIARAAGRPCWSFKPSGHEILSGVSPVLEGDHWVFRMVLLWALLTLTLNLLWIPDFVKRC